MAKQIIIMRKDLNMTKGKMVAQGAHASLAVILRMLREGKSHIEHVPNIENEKYHLSMSVEVDSELDKWLRGIFTKIAVGVSSEAELLEIYTSAKAKGLPAELIQDAGLTMFNGVPTYTCVAIGPSNEADLDALTGHLKLL